MNLLTLIQQYQDKLSTTDWLIYEHLQTCSPESLSLSYLSREVHVSTTTVFRFCQKLGLSGFGELKALLKLTDQNQTVSRQVVQNSYHDIVSYIDRLSLDDLRSKIDNVDAIYLFAQSELELRLAKLFQRIFFPLGKPMFILPHQQALEATMSKMDNQVLFVISLDREKQLPWLLRQSDRMKKLTTIVFSETRQVPILADIRLLVPSVEANPKYPHVITPYVLAVEMLYLKLQLGKIE